MGLMTSAIMHSPDHDVITYEYMNTHTHTHKRKYKGFSYLVIVPWADDAVLPIQILNVTDALHASHHMFSHATTLKRLVWIVKHGIECHMDHAALSSMRHSAACMMLIKLIMNSHVVACKTHQWASSMVADGIYAVEFPLKPQKGDETFLQVRVVKRKQID